MQLHLLYNKSSPSNVIIICEICQYYSEWMAMVEDNAAVKTTTKCW